jgi:hypothetical protein
MGILKETRAMGSLLLDCRFKHIRREANPVAHSLAQLALRKRSYASACASVRPGTCRKRCPW